MTAREATAEVFWTAFRALPKAERETVIRRLVRDPKLKEDLIDIVTALQRQHEKANPHKRVRADLKKTGRL